MEVVQILPAAWSERVAVNLGPGPADDVLAALLNGTKFNYIILNAQQNPAAPQRIVLLERNAAEANAGQPQNLPVATYQPPQREAVNAESIAEQQAEEEPPTQLGPTPQPTPEPIHRSRVARTAPPEQ